MVSFVPDCTAYAFLIDSHLQTKLPEEKGVRRIFPPQLFSLLSPNSFFLLYIGSLKQMSGISRIMCFSLFDWRLWFKTFRKVHMHSSHFHFPKSTGEHRIKLSEFTYACGLLKTQHFGDPVSVSLM